jgi:PAS domain S-box-containing protein
MSRLLKTKQRKRLSAVPVRPTKPSAVNIAEHTQIAESLSLERNLYRDLVGSLPAGVYRLRVKAAREWVDNEWIVRLGTNYSIEMANDEFCRILGVTPSQCEASTAIVAERIHPDDRPDFIAKNVAALNSPGIFQWNGRILKGDVVRWVHFLSVPRLLANGDMLWTGVLQDTTDRRQAAEALRESEVRYRNLFEQAGDPIVVFDPITTAFQDFNGAACRLMGYTRKEFSKLTLADLEVKETAPEIMRHVRKIMEKGDPVFETRLKTKSGDLMDFEIRPKTIVIGGKAVIQAIWHDITGRKRAEDLLLKSRDELEDKIKERTVRLRALAAELTQVEHKERRRIAHVLHEDLQQHLLGIQYKLHSISETGSDRSTSRTVNWAIKELSGTVQLTRELATHISPPVLFALGLRPALDWLARDVREKFRMAVEISGCRSFKLASDGVRDFAFDAIRELLLNIYKYAGVKSATIRLWTVGKHQIAIEVRDKGKGGAAIREDHAGFGLLSIRERAFALGLGFDVVSRPGKGTRVTLILATR